MPKFNVGDRVTLAPRSNSSKAFSVLSHAVTYTVEALGSKCSTCTNAGLPPVNGSVKVMGSYFCAEAFVPASGLAKPAAAAGAASGGVAMRREDPARTLYKSDADFWDTLPDPTHEEYQKLPSYEQLEERLRNQKGNA